MLIIGLYGAVYGIDVKHIQSQKKTIILLVSIGVISKMILIGG
jgi:NhaP-type Na+/H+ or K+/H+ antiporter